MLSSPPLTGFHKKSAHTGLPMNRFGLLHGSNEEGGDLCVQYAYIQHFIMLFFDRCNVILASGCGFCWPSNALVIKALAETGKEYAVSG
jgi:hypothetical protein